MAEASVVVTGSGALTSLGMAAQSYAAFRAGFSRIAEWEDFRLLGPDEEFDPPEPLRAAFAPLPYDWSHPMDRRIELALPALGEALQQAKLSGADYARARLSLALRPPVAPESAEALGRYVLDGFSREGSLPAPKDSVLYFRGHASFAIAVIEAVRALRAHECERAIVGGVDTFVDAAEVERLDRDFRLRSERAADGAMPGEAAAFVVLERADTAAARGARVFARVASYGYADEPRPLGAPEPCRAEGQSLAIRNTLARAERHGRAAAPPAWIVSDQNGERHRAQEWALTSTRLARELAESHALWHPATSFGDAGVASGALHALLAAEAWRCGASPAPEALLIASSDGPERAAVLLAAPGKE
ncbi:MAG: beta-ketoacyl synthase N-terminal-like domain-containing protein [Candidatus Eisenbacteria bacterium]